MAIRYVFRDEPLQFKGSKDADPQAIGEALAAIAEAAGGRLTPKDVVDQAREEDSPLHPHFEWNDAAAAEKFREDQARTIIRCIRVEATGNREPEPAFLSVSDNGMSYRTLTEIRSSQDLQDKLLAAAERDLNAFTVRYRTLKDICAIVETAKKVARSKRSNKETRVAA